MHQSCRFMPFRPSLRIEKTTTKNLKESLILDVFARDGCTIEKRENWIRLASVVRTLHKISEVPYENWSQLMRVLLKVHVFRVCYANPLALQSVSCLHCLCIENSYLQCNNPEITPFRQQKTLQPMEKTIVPLIQKTFWSVGIFKPLTYWKSQLLLISVE